MEMDFSDLSLSGFTRELASKAPTPGGGGASALAGAVGIALGNMVGELTVGKKKYESIEPQLRERMEQAESLRSRLLACVQKDAEAFEPLSRAYRIPKDDPSRDAVMEECLRTAARVPMEILDLCCEAIELQREFARMGSPLAVSDAATGVALCAGAMVGAAVNVRVNTKAMKDRDYAQSLNACVDAKMETYRPIAEQVYDEVYRRFC